jgi:O-acetyl-ADP-ribose deacetylase (regulator of RNase III)
MLKLEFKDASAVLLVLATLAVAVALLGTNPLDPKNALTLWIRAGFAMLGVLLLCGLLVGVRQTSSAKLNAVVTPEYRERLQTKQAEFAQLTPDHDILARWDVNGTSFVVLNENIMVAKADVVVSSDDNHFSAAGGVAKAILSKAGSQVEAELARYRKHEFRQGQLVVTTGGEWGCRALIHPAVIDFERKAYPTKETIQQLTLQCLRCASALGAESVALPVIGGGTASKSIKPRDCVAAVASEVLRFLHEKTREGKSLKHVEFYIFNREDAKGLPKHADAEDSLQ